jgi:hypothetical protein
LVAVRISYYVFADAPTRLLCQAHNIFISYRTSFFLAFSFLRLAAVNLARNR